MKTQKKLNLVLVMLIILLVSVVSFGGIYYKNKNSMSNILPSYILGNDLKGYRQITLELADSDSSESTEENTTNETATEETVTATPEDYKKSAEIIKKRLKSLKVDNYTVTCDENTGKIAVTLPEDNRTDVILSDLTEVGKFTITNAAGEELLNNSDIRKATIGVNKTSTASQMYMSIAFNTKGANKFAKVTKEYQNTTAENTTATNEATNETSNETSEETTETSSKEVTLKIDDSELLKTDFSQVIDNGVLTLTLGSSSSTTETSEDELNSAYNLAALLENEALPTKYSIKNNTYVQSVVDTNVLKGIICIEAAIALVIALVLIVKYRVNGIFAAVLSVGYVALLLIAIRLANVTISLEGIVAVLFAYAVNTCFSILFCKNFKQSFTKKEKKKFLKDIVKSYSVVIVPQLLLAVVCCFTTWAPIFSFGMIMFWGLLISWIYNIIMSKILM